MSSWSKVTQITPQLRKLSAGGRCDTLQILVNRSRVDDGVPTVTIHFQCESEDREYDIRLIGDEAIEFIEEAGAFFYEEEFAQQGLKREAS